MFAWDEDELLTTADGGGKKGETGRELSKRVSNVSAESFESRRRWGGREMVDGVGMEGVSDVLLSARVCGGRVE